MKKVVLLTLLLTGIVLCAAAQTGVIRECTGEVELKPAGASASVPARPGDTVAIDTVVSTGFKSSAIIELGSSVIVVRPLTRLSLGEIQSVSGAETLNVNLRSGRVRVDVNPSAGTRANFTVQSPIATASVRGTSFEFDTRNLKVHEGTVAFRGKSGMVMLVPAGAESHVSGEGKAADPIATTAEALTPPPPPGFSSDKTSSLSAPPPVTENIDLTINW